MAKEVKLTVTQREHQSVVEHPSQMMDAPLRKANTVIIIKKEKSINKWNKQVQRSAIMLSCLDQMKCLNLFKSCGDVKRFRWEVENVIYKTFKLICNCVYLRMLLCLRDAN